MRVDRRRFLAGLGGGVGGMLLALRAPGAATGERATPHAVLGRLMLGTLVEAEASHDDDLAAARAALHAGFDRIDDVDRLMSVFHDSEVTRLAREAGGGAVPVSEDTWQVLAEARRLAEVTRGALDVTILPLVRLWAEAAARGRVPARAELDGAARLVGAAGLVLDEQARTARLAQPDAAVDLGGIGKGFAVDVAVDALRARGVRRGIVNAGGDLRVLGRSPGGTPWRIGLRHPLRPASLVLALWVEDQAVCTSGNYFRYVTIGGRRYGHVLDPRRGTPAATALSVTAVAPTAMRADGLATGALVCGVEGALPAMAAAGADGVVVSEWRQHPGRVIARVTPGLAGRVERLDPSAVVEA
jgi:thiamine biosynthesis lipoprotein